VGTVNGTTNGTTSGPITSVVLGSGDQGINYDFVDIFAGS
jgi:hypothetical protein